MPLVSKAPRFVNLVRLRRVSCFGCNAVVVVYMDERNVAYVGTRTEYTWNYVEACNALRELWIIVKVALAEAFSRDPVQY